jgi:hypothetical protein
MCGDVGWFGIIPSLSKISLLEGVLRKERTGIELGLKIPEV